MKLSRRTFLKVATVSAGALAFRRPWQAPNLRALTEKEITEIPGGEKWVSSVCLQCDAGCGIQVRVLDGRAIKIEGNPSYPTNQGRICPKGHAGLQVLYDPDRIKWPLKRVGERGAGQWQRLSWPEALRIVAERLRELRERGQAHSLVVAGGRYRGHMHDLMARFLRAFGSPNDIAQSYIGGEATMKAHYLTQGSHNFLAYDLDNTNYLLSFGASFAEAWRPTVPMLRAYGHMRQGRPGIRAKIVQIEPRFSISAAKADEWIPITPGTDGALALAIAHTIIKEETYDKDFIRAHAFGFEDWVDEAGNKHTGFRSLALKEYSPQVVSRVTGVPVETIVRVAKEFATYKPSVAVGERGPGGQSNGLFSRIAIHCLNALVGSINTRGGVITPKEPPFASLPPVKMDVLAEKGLSLPRIDYAGTPRFPLATSVSQVLPESILNDDPYPVGALFLYYTNPLFSRPDVDRFYKAFQKVPFILSFSPFMDESTEQADLILPDSIYLERWDDDLPPPAAGYPIFGIRQPVVEPLYDTANTGDVIIHIAKELGGTIGQSFPWNSYEEFLKDMVKGVYQARSGSIVANTFEEFWQKLLEKGGWWDTSYRGEGQQVFATPSGKFEFYSQTMRKKLEDLSGREARSSNPGDMDHILRELKIIARGDELFLPHYEPARLVGDERDYPFYLNTYKTMTHAEGRGGNQPWLQEIYGLHVRKRWDSWVELNPETAKELGIKDGDQVWVESVLGKIKVSAKVYPGAMPNVVNIPTGFGHRAYGRWAKDRGANPNRIIANEYDYLGGLVAWGSTRVKVYKA